MLRYVIAIGLGVTTVACDEGGGDDSVLREQLFETDYELVDAVDDVDALVEGDELIAADALPGVDAVEYEITAVEADQLVTRRIDGRTRRVVDEERVLADEPRRADADRLRLLRARLADRLRQARADRPDRRAALARIEGDDLRTEWLDRDGRRARVRERLDGR